jgi:pyruvate dehydrogenase complex dehydrogenase (E1) component
VSLGVDDWGQSGSREDLYQEYGIDVETIVNAALSTLEL